MSKVLNKALSRSFLVYVPENGIDPFFKSSSIEKQVDSCLVTSVNNYFSLVSILQVIANIRFDLDKRRSFQKSDGI